MCENLRYVFDVQGYDDADHVEIFSKLEETLKLEKTLKLENLVEPKGISICDNEVSFLQYSFSFSLHYFLSEIL